ncbi:ArsR/SmtB family transcription factor [Paenibacillus silagei]|uniref:Transcriptional regulator n=1 Tax=Paenibacillus silagei TaxID=1670801 RepID=A0ABS4NQ70_9BACL|nr:helix-turn-helix domain-containing protein [Paenibacillus silagei]MBP2112214.1 putative transcriptional regulator [Paenibacillus silagei]
MFLELDDHGISVLKALASDTRASMLRLLLHTPLTVSELAAKLNLSKAIVSRHIRLLEDAKLIKLQDNLEATDSRKKNFIVAVDHVALNLPQKLHLPFKVITNEIKLGYYSNFSVTPTCGLASQAKIIGKLDDQRTFVSNDRIEASLLWFAEGFVEYMIPNDFNHNFTAELLELSLELSSEFPGSNNNWPSDIAFYINDVFLGTWTAPGNFSDVRGKLTPNWWDNELSQYGLLKHLRVTKKDTGIDGQKISSVTLAQLKIEDSPFIKLRIGIDGNSKNKGGLTIFGEHFGNYPQNILLKLFYTEAE